MRASPRLLSSIGSEGGGWFSVDHLLCPQQSCHNVQAATVEICHFLVPYQSEGENQEKKERGVFRAVLKIAAASSFPH